MNFIERVKAVSLAGGRGKRLKPLTDGMPKALLPVGVEKKPMLEYTLKPWIKLGIKDYVFCIGYKGEMIEKYFGDGKKFGIKIQYVREKENLETGGAIKNALDQRKLSKKDSIVVFYCDDFVSFNSQDFLKFHLKVREKGFKATVIASIGFRCHFGIMKTENENGIKKAISFEEKPIIYQHANVGIYFLEPEVLQLIDEHQPPFKFERVILPELVEKGWLAVYEIHPEDWLPVNTDKEYNQALKMSFTEFYSKSLI